MVQYFKIPKDHILSCRGKAAVDVDIKNATIHIGVNLFLQCFQFKRYCQSDKLMNAPKYLEYLECFIILWIKAAN